jgi:hypothetical protein
MEHMQVSVSRKDVTRQYKPTIIKQKLVNLMKQHVGRKKAITQREIFTELYGKPDKYSPVEIYALWARTKEIMMFLRKNTYCFIASQRLDSHNIGYFVVKDSNDASIYRDHAMRQMNQMLLLAKQANVAVEQEFYKKLKGDIALPGKKTLLIQ